MRSLHFVAASLATVALVAAGCAAATPTPTLTPPPASASPATGSCPSAPDPGTPSGWGQPSTPPSVLPYLINSAGEMTCGANRLLFIFLDPKTNAPLADPKRTATIAFYDLARDPSKPTSTVDTSFVWAIENERGDYVADVDFAEAGVWGAEIATSGAGGTAETIRMTFQVSAASPVIRVGQPAPATKTPTAADVGGDVARISTDTKPDPALYRTSVDQALAKHQPFVLAFATPKFCQSAQCGPTLDRLKPYVARYPTVDFIHVEPYQLQLQDGQLQPVLTGNPPNLTPTEASNRWGLLSEPWIFVVDRDGIVRGSFELIFSDTELTAILDRVR
jgi:hypothetical protein